MWAAQNALMAAYHAGSPCPELAVAAAMCGGTWGMGAGARRRPFCCWDSVFQGAGVAENRPSACATALLQAVLG